MEALSLSHRSCTGFGDMYYGYLVRTLDLDSVPFSMCASAYILGC